MTSRIIMDILLDLPNANLIIVDHYIYKHLAQDNVLSFFFMIF